MALSRISARSITDATIQATDLADGSITTAKIADANVTAVKLADTAVSPGTYGGSAAIPVIIVDQQGRLTSATNTAISIPSGSYATNSNSAIFQANTNVTGNVTLSAGVGGLSVGPLTVAAGYSVTVDPGVRWVIL